MKKIARTVLISGLAAVMSAGMLLSVFAAEDRVELFSTSQKISGREDPSETITVGKEVMEGGLDITVRKINSNDRLVLKGTENLSSDMNLCAVVCFCQEEDGAYYPRGIGSNILLGEAKEGQEYDLYAAIEGFWESEQGKRSRIIYNFDEVDLRSSIWALRITNLPYGAGGISLDDIYFVKMVGTRNADSQRDSSDYSQWEQDEKGWRLQDGKGSYLTGAWWHSPYTGFWYYLKEDGYMAADTVVDGCTVDENGVWIQ